MSEEQRSEQIAELCMEQDEDLVRVLQGNRRRVLVRRVALFVAGIALSLVAYTQQRYLGRLIRGEIALDGSPQFVPQHRVDEDAEIDWASVHSRLLPSWIIARGRTQGPAREREDRAQRAYTELRYAFAADRNLVEIFDELETRLEDPFASADRIDYLLWAYNDYLQQRDVPWRLEADLHVRRDGDPTLLTRSYEVLEDLRSEEGHRLRLLRRADLTNIDEGFLGHVSARDQGALVMLDQVMQFGIRHVWPVLHGGLDHRLPASAQGIAPHVRAEALGVLSAGEYVLLHETAVDQQALIEVAASIHQRQECGNRFRIYGLPWNGLEPPDQRALVEALGRSNGEECPEVTLGEAARMLGASERLGSTTGLAEAVESLTTFVSRAVSVHELRHVADGRAARCIACPDGMSAAARDELSAYLTSFATPGVGYVALLQACSIEPADDMNVSTAPHAQALAIAFDAMLPGGCQGAIPEDLYARAAEAQRHFFGERVGVTMPESYPAQVRLLTRFQPAD